MFEALVDAISGSAWAYPIIFAVAFLDSFFPIVPSETAVITGGVLAGSGDLDLPLVLVSGAVGAFLGDNFAYLLGRTFGERLSNRLFRGKRAQRTLKWVHDQLEERGGMLIVIARFIPGGRTATTVTCGIVRYPWRRRFVPFTAIGGVGWALYAGLIGYLGGKSFEEEPWKGLLIAFAIAGGVALAIETVRHFRRRGKHASA
jgi:membrane protein DedA with SNARE-associated domain